MKKTNQFSVKGSYVSPNVKIAAVRMRRNILSTSPTDGYLRYGNNPGTVDGLDDEQGYGDI